MSDLETPSTLHPWSHVEKGGLYMVEGVYKGAGEMRGRTIVCYRKILSTESGVFQGKGEGFTRYLDDWHEKMEPAHV